MKKLFFILAPFLYLFILLFQIEKAFTQDLGRHLKTGEIIVHTLTVPKTNLYSYVEPNHLFINHHWLSEVIFYTLSQIAGLDSLILLKIVAIFISFALVFRISYSRAGPFWTFVFSIPYLYLFSYRFDLRPEVFSFVCISLFIFLIEKFRQTRNSKFLVPLPFIELLWVNLHIYFIVGILLFGIFTISEIIQHGKKVNRHILLIGAGILFTTLINPNGIAGSLAPATILAHYGYSIVENQTIFFLNSVLPNPYILVFEALAVVGFVLLVAAKKKDRYIILLFLSCAALGAYMVRNFPIFVLVTFPYSALLALEVEKKIDLQIKRIFQILLLCGIGVFLFFDVSARLTSPARGFSYFSGASQAVDFFEQNHLKGPVFNNFDIGSYLIYRLYPQEKVYVDGRPEAYSVAFFDEYKKMQESPTEFAKQDAQYHFNTIIFSHTDITPWAQTFLASTLKNPEWVPVYLDPMMVIFVKNIVENKQIIEKHKVKI